ncbi:hypothetical protein ACYOEI_20065 [Singulisphaera rosea]
MIAAALSRPMAAKPAFWLPIAGFWAIATVVMAVLDLFVSCLVEPWRTNRRFSHRTLRRLRVWMPAVIIFAAAGTVWMMKWQFDSPLNPKLIPGFLAVLVVSLFATASLDLAARFTVMGLGRRLSRQVLRPV